MCHRVLLCFVLCTLINVASAQDTIEFLSGAKLQGKVTNIDKTERKVSFQSKLGSRSLDRDFPYSRIHAVTFRGQRYVLTPKPDDGSSNQSPAAGTNASSTAQSIQRSRSEIDKLIGDIGRTPPDWYDSEPLDYPDTLDLTWPLKPPQKGWNNKKNVGQYLWDIIHPNPNRWRSGIKLIHHIMPQHKNNKELLRRDMIALGSKYFELFQDYPRAAFWFRQARTTASEGAGIMLAECYYRLGNKPMAVSLLNARSVHPQAIKLWGDMGETKKALELANRAAKNSSQPHVLYLLAADALRLAGQHGQAVTYYENVINAGKARNEEYDKRFKSRARESIEAIRLFDQADVGKAADGTYDGSATGYNGAIDVEVNVTSGRIEMVKVIKHREKQFYAALTDTPSQIINKQSVRGIDATSRATITSQAIVNASAKALAKGSQ